MLREYGENPPNQKEIRPGRVLGLDLRWQEGSLEAWESEGASWIRISDLPQLESRRQGQLDVWHNMLEPRIGPDAWQQ